MAPRRLFVPGLSHHIRHRGNNRCEIFKDDCDRRKFLALLGKSARQYAADVHAYVLMTTHIHAVVTGHEPESLPRMMQSLGRGYVRYFNARHRRIGTLWEGRYGAGLIADERHWLNCLRYVEMNPVAARMVPSPGDYRWSSYVAHAHGISDDLLTPHPLFQQLGTDTKSRAAAWAALCSRPLSEAELAAIRRATRRGEVLGGSTEEPESEDPLDFDPEP